MQNTKYDVDGLGVGEAFDGNTYELVHKFSPIRFVDDFLGAGGGASPPAVGSAVFSNPWVKKIVGAAPPTVAGVANAAAGAMECTLTATSEKQDAALYFGDQLNFDPSKGLVVEFAARLTVLPSVAGVQCVWGIGAAWADGPDNIATYAQFEAGGNGEIFIRANDGIHSAYSLDTGLAVLATDFHLYRIDFTDPTNVQFFIDGKQPAVNAKGSVTCGASGVIWQPYMSAYKPSGTGVGTLRVGHVRVHQNR